MAPFFYTECAAADASDPCAANLPAHTGGPWEMPGTWPGYRQNPCCTVVLLRVCLGGHSCRGPPPPPKCPFSPARILKIAKHPSHPPKYHCNQICKHMNTHKCYEAISHGAVQALHHITLTIALQKHRTAHSIETSYKPQELP